MPLRQSAAKTHKKLCATPATVIFTKKLSANKSDKSKDNKKIKISTNSCISDFNEKQLRKLSEEYPEMRHSLKDLMNEYEYRVLVFRIGFTCLVLIVYFAINSVFSLR